MPDHIERQSQSTLDTPTIQIRSLVVKRRKKATQQVVAVGTVDLHGVTAGFPSPSGSLAKFLNNLLDLIQSQLFRDFSMNARWDGRGGNGLNSGKR